MSVFGQVDYLRDTFKRIDYLVAPAVGAGLKVIDTETTQFSADAGIGIIFEKTPGVAARTNAAITASEKLTHQLTPRRQSRTGPPRSGRPTTCRMASQCLWGSQQR
ncbi:MAG: DUF481 domain-containing protein [Acidobacteria bacterium]|nr:DUF481 domain-containing protein [Acidobacteriota bacterium]